MKKQHGFSVVEGLLIIVIVGLIGLVGWYVYKQRASKLTDTPTISGSHEQPVEEPKVVSTLENGVYTNFELGFSVKLPPKAFVGYGSCVKEKDSYRPKIAEVPIVGLQSGNTVYIASEYSYRLSGESQGSTGGTNFAKCTKTTNKASEVNNEKIGHYIDAIPISVGAVEENSKIIDFFRKEFSVDNGMKVVKITDSKDGNWQDVVLDQTCADGEDMCFGSGDIGLNQNISVRYYKDKKKLVVIQQGQSYRFFKDAAGTSNYDDEIVETFTLL